jgi:ribonuclease HI
MSDTKEQGVAVDTAPQTAAVVDAPAVEQAAVTKEEVDAAAAEESKPEANEHQGIILYTDGGCRPNPGPGGWGMHGYLFIPEVPKKPSGHPEHVCTAKGYVSKAQSSLRMGAEGKEDRRRYDRSIEVTPIHYIDGYGSFISDITNNVAEIEAATQACRHGAQFDIETFVLYTDSEHVVNGVNSWAPNWEKNGWLKPDGTPPANVENWKGLLKAYRALLERGVKVEFAWVKAHTDNSLVHDDILGNIQADRLATAGVMASRMKQSINSIQVTAADSYWKFAPEKHPFINNRRMYFNTVPEYIKPGEYYLGEHGKDDDVFGKRVADGAFAVVKLTMPDPVLEMIRNHQAAVAAGMDSIIMARLDEVFKPEIYQELLEMGPHAIQQPNPYRLDLLCLNKQPLTREFKPPKLAMRAVENISELAEKLELYLKKDPSVVVTDLTSTLYETSEKKAKKGEVLTQVKLKPEYNVGYAALQVDAHYETADGIKTAPVTLTLGIDMLDRNALKRLEDRHPKVSLITWLEAPGIFRYATVIEAGSDKGIWAGVYSNLRIVAAS